MSETHWRKLFNPNYMGDYSFKPGEDRILTISKVTQEMVTGEGGKKDECTIIYWHENEKPLIANKTNCRTIEKLSGSPYIERWSGLRIQLWYDPSVRFGKDVVGGIRVRNKLPEDVKIVCSGCGKQIRPAFGMNVTQLAAYTKDKYGEALCADCAQAKKSEVKENADS